MTQIKPLLKVSLTILIISVLLAACAPAAPSIPTEKTSDEEITVAVSTETETSESSDTPTETEAPTSTATITPTPDLRLDPEDWQEWPVIPTVSANVRAIYEAGLADGNRSVTFLQSRRLPKHPHLLPLCFRPCRPIYTRSPITSTCRKRLTTFPVLFLVKAVATAGGMNVASVLSHYWANKGPLRERRIPIGLRIAFE